MAGEGRKIYVVNDEDVPLGELQVTDIIQPLLGATLWFKQSTLDAVQTAGS